MTDRAPVAVVVPVYRNAETLDPLVDRLAVALDAGAGRPWRVRLVVDACPRGSAATARALAVRRPRVAVTELATNVGQHAALRRGLADEPGAATWACLDADLQDPPEAVPALLDRLGAGDVDAVFAGRRGAYESTGRRVTGALHRRAVSALTGLPPDAGAFLVVGPRGRAAMLATAAPSVVVALGAARLPVATVPVVRAPRPVGRSAWSGRARVRQSVRSLAWAARTRAAQRTQR